MKRFVNHRKLMPALSLANLLFLRQWLDIGVFLPSVGGRSELFAASFWAILINVSLMGMVIWLWLSFAASRKRTAWEHASYFLCFLALCIPLNVIRFRFNEATLGLWYWRELFGAAVVLAVIVAISALCLLCWFRFARRLSHLTHTFLTLFFPLVLITFGKGAWMGAQLALTQSKIVGRDTIQWREGDRFVFMLFDGFDHRLGIRERRSDTALPELDRWIAASTHTTNAYSPSGCTTTALPSYLTGKKRELAYVTDPNFSWARETLLHSLKQRAVKTALLGWYIPYCNLLGEVVQYCHHHPAYNVDRRPLTPDLSSALVNSFINFVITEVRTDYSWLGERLHLQTYRAIFRHAQSVLADKSFRFVFIHWPIPHPPWIFDRRDHAFTTHNRRPDGYLDNQQLVDQTLSDVRKLFEATGDWGSTTFLVTSDHWSREAAKIDGKIDHRIPWLLKLPDQKMPMIYDRPFNATSSSRLVHKWADGRLRNESDVITELDEMAKEPAAPSLCESDGDATLVSPM